MRSDVPVILAATDIFVLSSKFEPYGVALLEAMAAGKAIVSTRVNETPDILAEGECGLLVPPQDPQELASAIVRLLSDPGLSRVLGEAARRRAEKQYSIRQMVKRYEELYRSACGAGE
jgi:glycosyltransferase involved in cell wall biosynthesis